MARVAVEIAPIDPADPRAQHCLRQFELELGRRFSDGFDPAQSISADPAELRSFVRAHCRSSVG